MAQFLLAPGMDKIVSRQLSRIASGIAPLNYVLDIGCGPSSRHWKIGISHRAGFFSQLCPEIFRETGGSSVTTSATGLPFRTNSFDALLCFGLVHHLQDDWARQTLQEALRVTRSSGQIIVFDPVLPKRPWLRPIAWSLCKLDRGRFIRSQPQYESQILPPGKWRVQRIMHSYLGTEGIFCVLKKP